MELGNLFSLSGRIGRKDYIIVAVALVALGFVVSAAFGFSDVPWWIGILETVVAMVVGIPNGFKRLHDTDKSGWWLLLAFVPIIGWVALFIILWILPGDPGQNSYGTPNDTTPFPSLHMT